MAEGGGGGPSGPIVIQPGRGGDRGNFWSRNTGILGGLFLGPSQLKPYQEKSWLRKTLGAAFSEALWQTKEGRTQLMQLGYDIWRATKLANPMSSEYRRTYGKPGSEVREALKNQRALDRLRSHAAPPQDPVPQRPPTQRTPGTVQQSAFDRLLEVARLLAQWYAQQQQARADREAARDARRQQQMALGDLLGDVIGGTTSVLNAASPAITAYLNARASRNAVGFSGVPVGAGALPGMGGMIPALGGAVLGGLLGESPGQLESGGIFEGLETEIERDTVLWKRSGVGSKAYPVRVVYARNPSSGQLAAWTYAGHPVLYSGDLATCRRVNRITRRAAGRVGLRFRRRGRR